MGTHPGAPSHCRSSAFTPFHAAKKRESIKTTKYQALAAAEDCKFVPFIQESFGGFGTEARKFISELARQSKAQFMPTVTRFRDYASLHTMSIVGGCMAEALTGQEMSRSDESNVPH